MKRKLCLFMVFLLLLMSVGCGQAGSRTPGIAGGTASENVDGSVTTEKPDGSGLNTDSGADSSDGGAADTQGSVSGGASADSQKGVSGGGAADTQDANPGAGESSLEEDGSYTSKEDVALYIHLYGHLPSNFITKKEAEKLGWKGGSLEPFAPGKCIGGSRFGNYEELLPQKKGRSYTECDIDTLGADKRGAKRIVFSNDGLIYYTEDHYESFELLYGEADP